MQRFLKSQIDFWGSFFLLFILAPLFLVVVVFVKIDSSGPVFFRHERIGKGRKPFSPFKFRTMVQGAEKKGLKHTVSRTDERITRIGRILRSWGIDEFPQLINVVKGEMSLVGPRPTLLYQVEKYSDFQKKRLLVKPGIVGLALIMGRNRLSWEKRIQYDVWYVEHWSLWLDLKIMLKSLYVVLISKDGLYGPRGINDSFE